MSQAIKKWLVDNCGVDDTDERLSNIARVLFLNDLIEWWQMGKAPEPEEWEYAEQLTNEDILLLKGYQERWNMPPKCTDNEITSSCLIAFFCCRSPKRAVSHDLAAEIKQGYLGGLSVYAATNVDATGSGPMMALRKKVFEHMTEAQKAAWLEKARIDALLGGMRCSLKSMRSGIRCYRAFVGTLICGLRLHTAYTRKLCTRPFRSRHEIILSTKIGYTAGMVDTISVERYALQLSRLCKDRLYDSRCRHKGKFVVTCNGIHDLYLD